jgi:hypothetical protein
MGPCWDCTVYDVEVEAAEGGSPGPVLETVQAKALVSTPGTEMTEQERGRASMVDIGLGVPEIRLGTVLEALETGHANRAGTELAVLETLLDDFDIVLVVLEMAPASRARTGRVVLETVLLSMAGTGMEVLVMVLANETGVALEVREMALGHDCGVGLEVLPMAHENVLATWKEVQAKLLERARVLSV